MSFCCYHQGLYDPNLGCYMYARQYQQGGFDQQAYNYHAEIRAGHEAREAFRFQQEA